MNKAIKFYDIDFTVTSGPKLGSTEELLTEILVVLQTINNKLK